MPGKDSDMIFLITFLIVCIILLTAFLLCSKRSKKRVIGFFLEDASQPPGKPYISFKGFGQGEKSRPAPRNASGKAKSSSGKTARRNPNQSYTEMALLQQKIDERRRVVDSSGHSTLYDEYFELVFETRKGELLHLVTSRAAFKEVPFNQEGALTHKKGVLIKFKYAGGLISDEYSPIHNG